MVSLLDTAVERKATGTVELLVSKLLAIAKPSGDIAWIKKNLI
jgi:hypothetical protein